MYNADDPENIKGVAKNAFTHGGGWSTWSGEISYDLFFTEERMVMIHVIDPRRTGGGLAGPLTSAVQEAKQDQKEKEYSGLTLNEKLKKDEKNFAVAYDKIQKIKLAKLLWLHSLFVYTSEGVKDFSLYKEEFKKLVELLPTIDLLKDKLETKA